MNAKKSLPELPTLLSLVIFCGIGVVMMYHSTIFSGFSRMQTDIGDTRLNNYFLEHSFQWLINRDYTGGLWAPSFFHPATDVLAYSDNLFGAAPVYWLFRVVAPAPLAFQLWMIAVSVLNFLCFFWLLKYLKVSNWFSNLGAFLFAFGLPRVVKIGHQQLLPQFFTPIVLIAIFSFIKQPKRKTFISLLVFSYLQILAGIYLGWFLLFSLPFLFLFAYLLNRPAWIGLLKFWRVRKVFLLSSVLGWLIATGLTLWPYLERSRAYGGRTYAEIDTMLPRLASWFSFPDQSILRPIFAKVPLLPNVYSAAFSDIPILHEHHMYMGLTLLLGALGCTIALIRKKSGLVGSQLWIAQTCLFTFAAIFLVSLRLPMGVSLWRLVFEVVPGASAIRAVTRIWTMAYCYLLIAVCLWADQFFGRAIAPHKKRFQTLSLLCLFVALEQTTFNQFSFEKAPINQDVADIEALITNECDLAYLSFSPDDPDRPFYSQQLSAMWAGIQANVPVINGYSGGQPETYPNIDQPMTTEAVVSWLDEYGAADTGSLCIVGDAARLEADSLLPSTPAASAQENSGNLSMYKVQLPLDNPSL
ncbi:MAG: hypothetical protein AAFQ63_08250 [Cyanobacteria bacterium J06621_11]